ncbi:MAG: L-threonylcarbamoyladenylate synthase [Chloroflexota bacterium]
MQPTLILDPQDPGALPHALQALQAGEAVAFPTDTVYGLGAALTDPQAIDRLYEIKGRDSAKAIAVLLDSPQAISLVAGELAALPARLAERFWPGPLTLVVPQRPGLPANLSPLPTVGVRMPDHPLALALLSLSGPLAVTSANLSGAPNTVTAQDVFAQLGGRIPCILDGGRTPGGLPSTVVDCTGSEPKILRPGPITLDDLINAL